MTPKERKSKINAMTHALDKLQQGLAVLKVEGYHEESHVAKRIQCGIDLLQQDIRGLERGTLPFITVIEEAA